MAQKTRIYVDMDGTLANFSEQPNYLERMFEKGFFEKLRPYKEAVKAVNVLAKDKTNYEVFVLSACVDGEPPYCMKEKNKWIDKYLPNINEKHRIFIPMGANKAKLIKPTSRDILYDDYNVNLIQWEEYGGIAVKCLNDVNGKGLHAPHFEGRCFHNDAPCNCICNYLHSVAKCNDAVKIWLNYQDETVYWSKLCESKFENGEMKFNVFNDLANHFDIANHPEKTDDFVKELWETCDRDTVYIHLPSFSSAEMVYEEIDADFTNFTYTDILNIQEKIRSFQSDYQENDLPLDLTDDELNNGRK